MRYIKPIIHYFLQFCICLILSVGYLLVFILFIFSNPNPITIKVNSLFTAGFGKNNMSVIKIKFLVSTYKLIKLYC